MEKVTSFFRDFPAFCAPSRKEFSSLGVKNRLAEGSARRIGLQCYASAAVMIAME